MAFDPEKLARENIRRLAPYSSARHEFAGMADVYLDANENAFGSPIDEPLNRYPDPLQTALKEKLAASKNVGPEQIFIGNGSDEAIDLLFRIFCEPGGDEVIVCPPTYGMYKVAADINDVPVMEILLTEHFQLDVAKILDRSRTTAKLIFICSPNNPTGNSMRRGDILEIANAFHGIVVVDEAYIQFSSESSLIEEIENHPNLVVLQTFSKAWGLAGARVGMAFANVNIIDLFNRVKPPYNVSQTSQDVVLSAMRNESQVDRWAGQCIEQRTRLHESLLELKFVDEVYPSDANFLLVKMADADAVYQFLLDQKIVVRNRSRVILCKGCLRITVGTHEENSRVISALSLVL